MSKINLGIDLGSYQTVIFREGKGIVLTEPNKVLCESTDGEVIVRAFGNKAIKQTGEQFIVSPIMQGEIVDENYARLMLKNFIKCVIVDKPKATVNAFISLPCGISSEQKQKYYNLAYSVGISTIKFIPTPIADLLGCGISFDDFENCILVDIGQALTDIAILGKGRIVDGITINQGTANIDYAIISQVQAKFGVKIGNEAVKTLKEQIGTLLPDGTRNLTFTGTDMNLNVPKTIKIASIDILEPLREFYQFFSQNIMELLSQQDRLVINNIIAQGVIFCGSGSKVEGLKDFMQSNLNLPVFVASGERRVLGLSKVFYRKNLLKQYN